MTQSPVERAVPERSGDQEVEPRDGDQDGEDTRNRSSGSGEQNKTTDRARQADQHAPDALAGCDGAA